MKKPGTTPLIKALVKRNKLNIIPLHMPGHKKGKGVNPVFARLMQEMPFSLDMTELPGLDDLHNATGPIKDAQARAASVFGADRSFFLVNGSTVGLHAAILAACGQDSEIILPRDVHKSVIGACILSGAIPRYLPVRINKQFLIPYPPTSDEVAAALNRYTAVKAVLQVYPSYYGTAGDLASVVNTVHEREIPVIVDEAHGAHFGFYSGLPQPALKAGADAVIQSTHKTLGALTQASMLHLNSQLISYAEVARQLAVLQSTSPSYILMASLDAVVAHLEGRGKMLVRKAVKISEWARSKLNLIPGVNCMESVGYGVKAYDPTKLYISLQELGLTGQEVATLLLNKYKIQVELSDRLGFLCMFSLGNSMADAERLVGAVQEIAAANSGTNRRRRKLRLPVNILDTLPGPKVLMSPRQAWFSPGRQVPLNQAAGKIAAEIVAPYPPGIPLLCPGEEISYEIIESIRQLKSERIMFHGPADQQLAHLTVVDV